MTPFVVVSKRGVERLRAGHVWIYQSDLVEAQADRGDIVRVTDGRGRPLGWAFYSTESQIAVRMVSDSREEPDERALIDGALVSLEALRPYISTVMPRASRLLREVLAGFGH